MTSEELDASLASLTLVSALGCGLMAGIFYAFSSFVMTALQRLPTPQGIAAMQSINIAVINPWFLVPFFGLAAACAVLALDAVLRWPAPRGIHALVGGLLYLVGTLLVTIACNVPRNDALAAVEPGSLEGARLWAVYLVDWTRWNHVRAAAALAAAASFTLGLCWHPRG